MKRRGVVGIVGVVVLAATGWLAYARVSPPIHEPTAAERAALLPRITAAAERDAAVLGDPQHAFCTVEILATDGSLSAEKERTVYAQAACDEINRGRSGALRFGAAIETPIVFAVNGAGASLRVDELDTPGDGSYADDVERMYPRQLEQEVFGDPPSGLDDAQCQHIARARVRLAAPAPSAITSVDGTNVGGCPAA